MLGLAGVLAFSVSLHTLSGEKLARHRTPYLQPFGASNTPSLALAPGLPGAFLKTYARPNHQNAQRTQGYG